MTQITYDTDYNPIKKTVKKWKCDCIDNHDDITKKRVSGVKKTIFIIHMQIQASRDNQFINIFYLTRIIKSQHCTDALCDVGVLVLSSSRYHCLLFLKILGFREMC